MRGKKFRFIWLVPPVLLAALLIWVLAFQANYTKAEKGQLLSQGEAADKRNKRDPATGISENIFYIDTREDSGDRAKGSQEIALPDQAGGASPAGGDGLAVKQEGTLLFAGDIYLSSHVLDAYDRAGGIGGVLDLELQETIKSAGIFMANEEFPFSDRGTAALDKQYTFRLPPERVEVMRQIGPDLVALANNHALDYGADALLDTCRILEEAGILYVGAGADLEGAKAPVFLDTGGMKIGFLAASRVIPESAWAAGKGHPGMFITYDPAMLVEEIRKAEEQCDFLVVYVHWGIERSTKPEEYQRKLGEQYIDAGADLVVGSHPHVLQGIEYYKGKPIVYSLGNFIFGSSIPKTALLEVNLLEAGERAPKLRLIPCTSSNGFTRSLEVNKRAAFFEEMEAISFGVTIDAKGGVSQAAE